MTRILGSSPSTKKRKQEPRTMLLYFLWMVAIVWMGGTLMLVWMFLQPPQQQQVNLRRVAEAQVMSPQRLMEQVDNPNNNPLIQHDEKTVQHDLNEQEPLHSTHDVTLEPFASPLLVFTCQRAAYLERTLNNIFQYLDNSCRMGCPIVISQDGTNAQVVDVINKFQVKFAQSNIPLIHLQHKAPSEPKQNVKRGHKNVAAVSYQKLAQHYGWALSNVFSGQYVHQDATPQTKFPLPQRVLILEEDLDVSPDFFHYMETMAPLLDSDKTLLAVSAFNDNGSTGKVYNTTRVLRSDFFPGLGWLMTRQLWNNELESKWPAAYWDDWLREPLQRQGRHVLRPEVSRTFHFGSKGGASFNQFGKSLSSVQLNSESVDWKAMQTTLSVELELQKYNAHYYKLLQHAILVQDVKEALDKIHQVSVKLEYKNMQNFVKLANELGLMKDEKAGVPRTAYKGIVETRPLGNDKLLFLIPKKSPDEWEKEFL